MVREREVQHQAKAKTMSTVQSMIQELTRFGLTMGGDAFTISEVMEEDGSFYFALKLKSEKEIQVGLLEHAGPTPLLEIEFEGEGECFPIDGKTPGVALAWMVLSCYWQGVEGKTFE